MERHTVFTDQNTQHSKGINSSKLIHRFNAIPINISRLFVDINEPILKFIWKGKWFKTTKTNLMKKKKVEEITVFNFKICNIVIVIETVQ